MVVNRLDREEEALGDLGVREPLLEQREDLGLARREAGRVPPSGCARAAREAPGAAVAQPAGHDRGGRPGVELLETRECLVQRIVGLGVREREGGLEGAVVRLPPGGRCFVFAVECE